MNQYDFTNRMAIVTGGAQGIGFAVAKRLVDGGARVALWDMDEVLAHGVARELGADNLSVSVDISDATSVEDAYKTTLAEFGHVDIVVNSAGIAGPNATVEAYPVEEFEKVVAVNLLGTFYVNRVVIGQMKTRNYGRIVNIASVAGKEGNPNASAYSSSKAGVIGFTKSLGKELAEYDIAVNCITPAAARTRIFDQMKQEHIDYMLSKIPRGRFLEVDEVASMVAWLVSEENSFTTAGTFDLSGGRATY